MEERRHETGGVGRSLGTFAIRPVRNAENIRERLSTAPSGGKFSLKRKKRACISAIEADLADVGDEGNRPVLARA